MKTIVRRLRKLEDRFGLAPETEFDRQLLAQIEAGRRRVADARERGWLSSPVHDDEEEEDLTGLSVAEILDRGRARVARAKVKREAAASTSGLVSRGDVAAVSESPTKLADHNDEEDAASVPAPEPAHPPIINVIAQRHRLTKPKELGLNVHGNPRPNTSMARLGRTVNPRILKRR